MIAKAGILLHKGCFWTRTGRVLKTNLITVNDGDGAITGIESGDYPSSKRIGCGRFVASNRIVGENGGDTAGLKCSVESNGTRGVVLFGVIKDFAPDFVGMLEN